MPPRLRDQSLARIDQDQRQVGRAGGRHHVARVLFVAGSIGDDEFAAFGAEVAIGDIDGDALLALGLQAVGEQREVDAFAAAPFVVALGRGDLIFEGAARVDEQPSDQRGFAIVDAAGGDESKQTDAQKYPSRFLSSIVLAP